MNMYIQLYKYIDLSWSLFLMFSRNYCLSSIFILFLLLWSLFLMFCRNCCLSSIFILFLLSWSLCSRNCCLSCIFILFLLSWSLFLICSRNCCLSIWFIPFHHTWSLFLKFWRCNSRSSWFISHLRCCIRSLFLSRIDYLSSSRKRCRLLLCLSLAASLCCDLLSSIVLDGPNGLYLFCR